MSELKYVVVCSDGTSHDMSKRALFTEYGKPKHGGYDLQELLEQGWVPVRETAMGGGDYLAYAVILLQRPPPS
jgi:hypothetical protein